MCACSLHISSPTINQSAVVHSHCTHTPNELQVLQMVLIEQPRVRVELEGVVITTVEERGGEGRGGEERRGEGRRGEGRGEGRREEGRKIVREEDT